MDIHEIRSLLDEWARNRARIGELSEKYRTAAELLDKVRAALAGAVVAEPWAPVVEFGDVDAAEGFLGRYSDTCWRSPRPTAKRSTSCRPVARTSTGSFISPGTSSTTTLAKRPTRTSASSLTRSPGS